MAQENDVIGSYFLELWRINSRTAAASAAPSSSGGVDSEFEEEPTELNTLNSSGGFSMVGPDKLTVRYPNVNLHGHDVGVVQANKPAPSKRLMYYFEMSVKSSGAKGQMSIGFTSPGFKMRRQPGWEANSYGYHGDDGLLYRGHGKGEAFGPTYTEGDTVGGGINYATQEFFFTKNGTFVGKAFKDVKGPLFPTVAVHSQNEEITVNFGKDPFVFDIKDFEAKERTRQQMTIDEIPIPQDASHRLVLSYLQHYGYVETLNAIDLASENTVTPTPMALENESKDDVLFAMNHRKDLRELIRNGNIDDAFDQLRAWYPNIVQDDRSAICFLLNCQKFIELVRNNKPEEAMWYAKKEFIKFYNLPEFDELAKDCTALLAYEQPLKSSVGYLLGDSQREILADAVNSKILSINPNIKDVKACLHSGLDMLLRQLTACYLERRLLNGNQGEAFNLSSIFNSRKEN